MPLFRSGIVPYDDTRVTLPGQPDFYLNASWVRGSGSVSKVVAAQSPTAETVGRFWTALVGLGVRTVVMAGKNVEKEKG